MIIKFRLPQYLTSLVVGSLCQRWSLIAPLIVYIALLSIVKLSTIPLRSSLIRKSATDIENNKDQDDQLKKKSEVNVILAEVFHSADSNNDDALTQEEVSEWISKKTNEHIQGAMLENYGLFIKIDLKPRNGLVSWVEYHNYFLQSHGFSADFVDHHNPNHRGLGRALRESIMRDKAAWSESAKTDPDQLTVDEFLAFRHPESSPTNILSIVDDLIEKFDRDGDGELTEEEFASLQSDIEGPPNAVSPVEAERRREFREGVDISKDGKATRQELLMHIDPKNPRHAKEEAGTLMILADENHDGRLSIEEFLSKPDLFFGSKMVDTGRSFHDEF